MLEFEEYKGKLNAVKSTLDDLGEALHLEEARREIAELETESAQDGFWNDVKHSQQVQQRIKQLKTKTDNYARLCSRWEDMLAICDMALEESDESLLPELEEEYALAKETLADNQRFFSKASDVPRWALSMGVGTIMDCQEILLLATGEKKADAVAAMIEGPISTMCTASALQNHPATTVVIDKAAASKLKRLDYWMQTADDYNEMYDYLLAARHRYGLE